MLKFLIIRIQKFKKNSFSQELDMQRFKEENKENYIEDKD